MLSFSADKLRESARRIFVGAGAPEDIALVVATSLVESNLVGHDSHGVIRVPAYVQSIERKTLFPAARPTVLHETPTTAVISGNWTFGQIAARYATEKAIEKAKVTSLAAIGVVQCNHIGRLGEYADMATKAGLVAIVSAGGFVSGAAAPFGGAARVMPTNPFAFGVPSQKYGPMIVDFATTVVAEGKLQMLRAKGEKVPEGWILDREGRPTTNVDDFYNGGMLLPFGGHKGFGLGLVAEVLSGSLAGVESFREEGKTGHGTFVLLIDPAAFRPFNDFEESVDRFFSKVKAVPPAPGFSEVLIPGEPESRSKAKRLVEGIPVPEDTWEKLTALAQSFSVSID